jgi:hypothetical protein
LKTYSYSLIPRVYSALYSALLESWFLALQSKLLSSIMSQTNKLKKRKAKSPTPPVDPSVSASTSATALGDPKGGITTDTVLHNTSALLEVLKSVSDAAQILGPLKAVCGVLKIAVDTAIVRNSN